MGSVVTTSTMSLINPRIVIVLISSTALLTSIASLFTTKYVSKLGVRYSELVDWIILIALFYETTLKNSVAGEKN